MLTNSNYVVSMGSHETTTTNIDEAAVGLEQLPSVGRRSKVQNVVPLHVVDLVQHQEEDGPFVLYGQEVGMVKILGQVKYYIWSISSAI